MGTLPALEYATPRPRCDTLGEPPVDFERAFRTVASHLTAAGQPFALVGGFALQAYGIFRMTLDLDFVTQVDAQAGLVAYLETCGYETLHVSSGYSNHLGRERSLGRLDFVYVNGETATRLFAGTEGRSLRIGGLDIPVPRAEHLAAMKVLAMKNDPTRVHREMADLSEIVRLPGADRMEIAGYFRQHGLEERWRDLEKLP